MGSLQSLPSALLALVLLAACEPGGGDVDPDLDPEMIIGTGEWMWEDVSDGDELTLSRGTQGGYHFWLSVRAVGVDPARIRMQLDLLPSNPDPVLEVHSDIRINLDEPGDPEMAADGWSEYIGFPAQLSRPWCVVDEPLEANVELEDRNGVVLTETVSIVPRAPRAGFPVDCDP